MIVYADDGGKTVNCKFDAGSGTVDLSETLTFIVDGKYGSPISPYVMSTDAAPPSSSPTQFLNPADYEKTMTLSALVTVSGVRQAVGVLYAFAGNQMRGVQATPTRPPFGPYSGSSVYQIVLYAGQRRRRGAHVPVQWRRRDHRPGGDDDIPHQREEGHCHQPFPTDRRRRRGPAVVIAHAVPQPGGLREDDNPLRPRHRRRCAPSSGRPERFCRQTRCAASRPRRVAPRLGRI